MANWLDKAPIIGYSLKQEKQENQEKKDICEITHEEDGMAKILIIDDDKDLAQLTKTALMTKGYQASILHSAVNIIEEIKARNPDLILMDIVMPGISGPEAVRNLKADGHLKDIPVVFLTGLISSGEENVEETGVNIDGRIYQTLGKPYEIDALLGLVKKLLIKM